MSIDSSERPLVSGRRRVRLKEMMLMTAKKKNWAEGQLRLYDGMRMRVRIE
jgi:hypothetical protein